MRRLNTIFNVLVPPIFNNADIVVGHIIWTAAGTSHLRCRIARELALDLLGWLHHSGCILHSRLLSSGNIQASDTAQTCRRAEKKKPRIPDLCAH